MALVLPDRVKETATTAGTGTFTLAGAVAKFQSFSAVGNGNTTYYCIQHETENEFEVGLGTYTASGTTLSRDTILTSTNSNNAVNFSAGDKTVFVVVPGDKTIRKDGSGAANITSSDVTTALGFTPISSADGGNAATLDSLDSTQFLRSDTTDTFTGSDFIIDNELQITNGDGTNTHFNYDNGGSQNYIRGSRLDIDVTGATTISAGVLSVTSGRATVGGSSYAIGFSTNGSGATSSIGHTATNNEGLFWHTGSNYGIYRTSGSWSSSAYQQLRLDWPTGIILSTSARGTYSYSYTRVDGSLTVDDDIRTPVYYDNNNTSYYVNPTSTTALRTVGSWRADSTTWDGNFNGKIQYHSNNWYAEYSSLFIFRSSGSNRGTVDSSGNATFNGNVTAYSDARLKQNIRLMDDHKNIFDKIDAKRFSWIESGKNDIGFIAQEVEAAGLPEVVLTTYDKDPSTGEETDIKSIDYGRMVSVLWQTVKDLKAEIDMLKE